MDSRERALKNVITALKTRHGEGVFISGEGLEKVEVDIDGISTGSAKLDNLIGVGGFPRGRLTEVYGSEGSGKTTLATLGMVNATQKYEDQFVGFLDVEHAFNMKYAKQLGLNTDKMFFGQPGSAEEAIDIMLESAGSGAFSMLVLDSVAALRTKKQLEKGIGEDTIGLLAKLMSENVPDIVKAAERTETAIVFINQIRNKIGSYGSPITTPGGNAIKFYASLRIETARINVLKDGDVPYGQTIKATLRKNKVGVPFGYTEVDLIFGRGFELVGELVELAIEYGIVNKAGAWLSYGDEKWQGKERLSDRLREDKELYNELYSIIFNEGVIEGED